MKERSITLVFPHQLFRTHPAVAAGRPVYLVEDSLFFGDRHHPIRFHVHKLTLHIASMDAYAQQLRAAGITVHRVTYNARRTIGDELDDLAVAGVREVHLCDLTDDVLTRRIERAAERHGFTLRWYGSPMFVSPEAWLREQLGESATVRMQSFYIAQRTRMGILVQDNRPIGGRWSFDTENRKSWPARTAPPPEPSAPQNQLVAAAAERVRAEFAGNPGATDTFWYPVTHDDAQTWLRRFLEERLSRFGPYEDAICANGTVLYHSVLTPMLNIGLLTPAEVLSALDDAVSLDRVEQPLLAGVEGFVRQIIGWREFIRGIYLFHGVRQRTTNYWCHTEPMPAAFYTATTGLLPADRVIERVMERSYCHHIERLMVLGNLMLLCEIHPDEVYRWFMELFIDAYDWVMVPNVYGMSQFADGGIMASKPYVSGANYIRKMSDFAGGEWEAAWTALFWRFLDHHRDVFAAQPRLGMLVKQLDRDPARAAGHRQTAERYLAGLRSAPPTAPGR
ncbi:MAG: cryptochrome/photolyase family protein [Spirochaetaceae bacterium]|nr:MAG: cryptochrome/photolyase family protein [Spirochaetaceae bacterium]